MTQWYIIIINCDNWQTRHTPTTLVSSTRSPEKYEYLLIQILFYSVHIDDCKGFLYLFYFGSLLWLAHKKEAILCIDLRNDRCLFNLGQFLMVHFIGSILNSFGVHYLNMTLSSYISLHKIFIWLSNRIAPHSILSHIWSCQ